MYSSREQLAFNIYRKKNENKKGKETFLKKKKQKHEELHRFILFPQSVQRRLQEPFFRRPPQRASGTAKQILSYQSDRASRRASILSPPRRSLVGRPNLVDYLHRRAFIFGPVSRGWGVGIWCRELLLPPVDAWLAEETAAVPCCSAWME